MTSRAPLCELKMEIWSFRIKKTQNSLATNYKNYITAGIKNQRKIKKNWVKTSTKKIEWRLPQKSTFRATLSKLKSDWQKGTLQAKNYRNFHYRNTKKKEKMCYAIHRMYQN